MWRPQWKHLFALEGIQAPSVQIDVMEKKKKETN